MFTGLIEAIGRLIALHRNGPAARFEVECPEFSGTVAIGDSVAVNGCCLTAVAIDGPNLEFDAGDETLARTSLGTLRPGDGVNLERAIRAGDRMGGHFVTGHVDAVIRLVERIDSGAWSTFWFELPGEFAPQIAGKGSVALNGTSLTVVDVRADRFSIMLIPHTLAHTTFGSMAAGDPVNLETDVLAKYVQRAIAGRPWNP